MKTQKGEEYTGLPKKETQKNDWKPLKKWVVSETLYYPKHSMYGIHFVEFYGKCW